MSLVLFENLPNDSNEATSNRMKGIFRSDDGNGEVFKRSDLLQLAYSKARSLTGVSLTSTEVSSGSLDRSESTLLDESLCEEEEDDDDIFFDCRSRASALSTVPSFGNVSMVSTEPLFDSEAKNSPQQYQSYLRDEEVAFLVKGKSIYSDGSPAHVPPGHSISRADPELIKFCRGNQQKAESMWKTTLQWREEAKMWNVLARPNARFHHAKTYYPSCYHGVDKRGIVVEYSYPGKMDPVALLPNKEVANEVMEHHYFMQEFVANCLYTHPEPWNRIGKKPLPVPGAGRGPFSHGLTVVIDLDGASLKLLSSDVFSFMKSMIDNSTKHFPTQAGLCLIVNAPFWVAGVFATLKPLLSDSLEVEIVSGIKVLQTLQKYIDDDQIPKHYGGSNPFPMHNHPFEIELHRTVDDVIDGNEIQSISKGIGLDKDAPTCSENSICTACHSDSCDSAQKSLGSSSSQAFFAAPVSADFDYENEDVVLLGPQPQTIDLPAIAGRFWQSLQLDFSSCDGTRNCQ